MVGTHVEVKVGAVLLLESNDLAQPAELALHRVDSLDDDDDLAPGDSVGLPLLCRAQQDRLQLHLRRKLAFTRYCHYQYCRVYGIKRGGGGGVVYCTIDVH